MEEKVKINKILMWFYMLKIKGVNGMFIVVVPSICQEIKEFFCHGNLSAKVM